MRLCQSADENWAGLASRSPQNPSPHNAHRALVGPALGDNRSLWSYLRPTDPEHTIPHTVGDHRGRHRRLWCTCTARRERSIERPDCEYGISMRLTGIGQAHRVVSAG